MRRLGDPDGEHDSGWSIVVGCGVAQDVRAVGVIEHAVDIDAPPEIVWRVYVDPVRLPEWQTGNPVIDDVTGPGDRVGTTYVSRRGPGAARTTIVESEPPRRLVTRTAAYFGLRFDVTSELRVAGPGTRLTIRAETRWPRGAGVLGRLIEAVLLSGGEARRELAALKAVVERERALPR